MTKRSSAGGWDRRRVLAFALTGTAAVIAAGVTGVELVSHSVLPGKALPPGAVVDFAKGCHTGPFFLWQEPPSLAFLARHLTR